MAILRFFLSWLFVAFVGCSREDGREVTIAEAKDLVGRKCAVVVGSMMGDLTLAVQPGIGIEWFNDYNSGIEAVRLGKVAAMPLDFFYARRWKQQSPKTFAITKPYQSIPWAYLFAKGSPLRDQVNAILAKMRESGDLERILTRWSESEDPGKLQLEPLDYRKDFTGKAGKLRFATPGDREPVSFMRADGIVGFDIDIVRRIAYELDMTLEIVQISMGALVPAVQSGKVEMGGGGMAITAERAEKIDFSECYYRVPTVFLIRASSVRRASAAELKTAADLKGLTSAAVLGTALQEIVESHQSGVRFKTFNDYPSALEALFLGKVDVMPMDTVVARRWVASRPDELRISLTFEGNPFGYFFAKGSPLLNRVNGILAKMRESGQLARIVSKWCNAQDINAVEMEPTDGWKKTAGTLRFATTGEYEPGSFRRKDEIVGFDIDLVRLIARELEMDLELLVVNSPALVPSVQTGKAEMGGGCVTITAPRQEKVDFTDCYLDDGFAILTKVESSEADTGRMIRTAADLKGAHVAHLSSDFHREELTALEPDIVFDPYTEYAFAFESLRKRKLDAISLGRTYADIWMAKYPGEFAVAFDYADDVCAFLLRKGSKLKASLDAELKKMADSGETVRIIEKWKTAAKTGDLPSLPEPKPASVDAPTVRVAAAALSEPWCFVAGGRTVGADIEILEAVAQRLGVRLETKAFNWSGMVDAVNAGKAEIGCGGAYTGGNTFPTVEVSRKYADERMCVLVRNEALASESSCLSSAVESLKASFVRTFVTESRWRLLANGLGVTLLITTLSAFFGTLLAFPVWKARTSSFVPVACLAKGYISLLQGTPVLVLLMILFYLVFGNVDIDGIVVAMIGFSLNCAAYVGEMLRSGIDSVPRGQTEAALALGYRPRQAFFRFVLPQAVRTVLPVYRGELIGLLKSTSIVGYIAICDLTKAGDLVRSRTYESFFPILTTAFIYFVAAWLLAATLDRVGRRLDPASRRKTTEESPS